MESQQLNHYGNLSVRLRMSPEWELTNNATTTVR
jgi:hypothetical protein